MPRFQYVFYIGDQKPIVISSIVSSTGATITAATCTLINHVTGVAVGVANQAMGTSGGTITSPYFTWVAGEYILQIRITFSDGIVDNSITVLVQVQPVPV